MATLPLLLRALHADRLRGGPGPVRTVGTRKKETLQLQPCEETGNPEADAAVGFAGEAECRISKAA